MRRNLLLVICLFLVFFSAIPNAVAETYRHPKTGIFFPDSIGAVRLDGIRDFEKEYPGLGVGISYRADTFKADVFIYDMGKGPIPTGVAEAVVIANFEQAVGDVHTLEKRGTYKDVSVVIKNETVKVRDFPFLHSVLHLTQDDIKRVSHVYLTGYKGHYVKASITYFYNDIINGEKTLAQFLNMLGDNLKAALK